MGAIFQGLLAGILSFFGNTIGTIVKRAPILSAFFVIVALSIATYITAMHALIGTINVTVPAIVTQVWGWLIPPNAPVLLSALYGARIAKWSHIRFMDALREKVRSVTR